MTDIKNNESGRNTKHLRPDNDYKLLYIINIIMLYIYYIIIYSYIMLLIFHRGIQGFIRIILCPLGSTLEPFQKTHSRYINVQTIQKASKGIVFILVHYIPSIICL